MKLVVFKPLGYLPGERFNLIPPFPFFLTQKLSLMGLKGHEVKQKPKAGLLGKHPSKRFAQRCVEVISELFCFLPLEKCD